MEGYILLLAIVFVAGAVLMARLLTGLLGRYILEHIYVWEKVHGKQLPKNGLSLKTKIGRNI